MTAIPAQSPAVRNPAPATIAEHKQAIDAATETWHAAVIREPRQSNYRTWQQATRDLWEIVLTAADAGRAAIGADVQALVNQVKAHAMANYNAGGWDVVVETMDDFEIAVLIDGTTTLAQALGRFSALVDIWADRQADAINSAF